MAAVRVVYTRPLVAAKQWGLSCGGGSTSTYLSVIDMSDSANVDMRLVALKDSGIAPRCIEKLCLAPSSERLLYWRAARCA